MRKRFRQRRDMGGGDRGGAGPQLAPASSTAPRGGHLIIEIAQWLVTTVTLGQAVWRWLRRAKSEVSRPPALHDQGKAP